MRQVLLATVVVAGFTFSQIARPAGVPSANSGPTNLSLTSEQAALVKMQADRDSLVQQTSALQKQFDAAAPTLKNAQAAWEKASAALDTSRGSGVAGTGLGQGEGGVKELADIKKAKAELGKIKGTSDALAAKINTFKTQAEAITQKIADGNGTVAQQINGINAALKNSALTSSFTDLRAKIGDTDLTLTKLDAAYDKSLLGAYLKDKVGLLLNSDLMCQAVKRCAVTDPKKIENKDIESTLFPNTTASTRTRSYYDSTTHAKKTSTN